MSVVPHFVSVSCEGERCLFWIDLANRKPCGKPATHKVGEEIPHDHPMPERHNFTNYVCCEHFRMILGPAVPCQTA